MGFDLPGLLYDHDLASQLYESFLDILVVVTGACLDQDVQLHYLLLPGGLVAAAQKAF